MKDKSRYRSVKSFGPDPRGNSDFIGVRPRDIPHVEALAEHMVKAGERGEQLSQFYYKEPRLWYRLGDANSRFLYSEDMVLDRENSEKTDILNREDRIGRIILIPGARD